MQQQQQPWRSSLGSSSLGSSSIEGLAVVTWTRLPPQGAAAVALAASLSAH
jgi:hypothetical protein